MELYAYSGGTVRDSHPIPLSIPADWYAPRGHKNIFCCPIHITIRFFFSQPNFLSFLVLSCSVFMLSVFVDATIHAMNISAAHFFH